LVCFTGKAEGVLFEDAGDGYKFTQGEYLLTCYTAELHSSVVTVKVFKSEGSWNRPKRNLKINILLGGGAMVCLLLSIPFFSTQATNIL
jgi:alpha-glucosidase